MVALVNLDGDVVPPEDAKVSVFDRGFLFGDSVYESLRTYGRLPFLLDRHLTRLQRSADRIGLALEGGVDRVAREIGRTLEACGDQETVLRIVATRGAENGLIDLDPSSAGRGLLLVIARAAKDFDRACYERGVALDVVSIVRNPRDSLDPAVKSGNYLNNVLAIREARRRGAFESAMLNADGYLTECSTSNLFLVRGGMLLTPAFECGLLDGVTRGCLFELAAESDIGTREALLTRSDLLSADEVFLSSSLKEVMPVRSVDGQLVGRGEPGPLTLRMLALYRARIARECRLPAASVPLPESA